MSEASNGGPAFPQMDMEGADRPGMTLRDYFAAKAMQAMIVSALAGTETDQADDSAAMCAGAAYSVADAMLKARDA